LSMSRTSTSEPKMDLRIIMRRCPREVSAEECRSVLEFLQKKGFKLLLRSANRAYFEALGMEGVEVSSLREAGLRGYSDGELIASDDWTEIVYLGHKTTTRRQPGARPSLAAPKIRESKLDLGSICSVGETSLFEPLR